VWGKGRKNEGKEWRSKGKGALPDRSNHHFVVAQKVPRWRGKDRKQRERTKFLRDTRQFTQLLRRSPPESSAIGCQDSTPGDRKVGFGKRIREGRQKKGGATSFPVIVAGTGKRKASRFAKKKRRNRVGIGKISSGKREKQMSG